ALAGHLSNFLGFSVFLLALATGITGFSDQPSRGAGPDSAAAHWSLLPLQRAEPLAVKDKAWAKTSIDRFILAKLEEQGLQPMPAADQRTLLRRVYFDLIGLPPALPKGRCFTSVFIATARSMDLSITHFCLKQCSCSR